MGTVLSVHEVGVSFHQYRGPFSRVHVTPLHGVSLSLAAGEILAVVGESGAGKSLLADAILGLIPLNAHLHGRVDVDRDTLRFIPQGVTHFDPTMKIGRFVGLDGDEATENAAEKLARFGLGPDVLDRFPQELSGGMLRRVSLATSVSPGTRLLIADEPTPGLDPAATELVLDYFRELRARGAAVLFITHDLVAATTVADRIAVMRDGTVVDLVAGDLSGELSDYTAALWRAQPANDFWGAQR
ncbi:MAG TPA: ATP-binding cassette domain-containing protein [Corynebacterium sp.]|nr:ATP-binding cassette domain-containing protein [Corynebacterium sp.]